MHEFLKTATFDEALVVANDFADTWTGVMPRVGEELLRFADSCEGVSELGRRMLLSIVERGTHRKCCCVPE